MKAITMRPRDHRTYGKTLPARDLQDSINIGCSRYSSVEIKDLAEQIKLIDIIWDLAKYLQKLLHKDYKILPV